MSEPAKLSPQESLRRANMIMGIGVLLTVVPLGLAIVNILITDDGAILQALASLGWAFVICVCLLPVGLVSFAMGLSRLMAAKRALKEIDESEE
ncbi:MAG: hypothetical protein SFU85_08155 [Candidatus Methylacidiphilales bacterium]|nr:hypothetical protein [Candidatus Methylacidiphilales bacterium]